MNDIDVTTLRSPRLETLARHFEGLIRQNRAALEDYDLYVRCQRELARRAVARAERRRRGGTPPPEAAVPLASPLRPLR